MMMKNLNIVVLLSFVCSIAIGQSLNQLEAPTDPKTKIEWHEPVFAFGDIEEGEIIKNVFTFTNTGKEPLIIYNAKGSCGCTVPMWPKEPIMPGESADLLVEFNSKGKGKFGGNLQSKRVTISTNTEPINTYLTIKGKVFRPEETTETEKPKKVEAKQIIKTAPVELTEVKLDRDIDSEKVTLYPNPTIDQLNVSLTDYANSAGLIEIYDGAGMKITEREVADFGIEQNFNVSELTPGVYTVSIKIDDKNRIAKRFILLEE